MNFKNEIDTKSDMTKKTHYMRDINNSLFYFCYIFISILLCIQIVNFCNIACFRHDDFRYIDDYLYNLHSEGRWINYLLFEIVKKFNPYAVFVANNIFAFFFFTSCYNNFCNIKYSILFGLMSLYIPSIFLLNEWPLATFNSYFLLFFASLSYRKIPTFLFFIIFGILFNGVISHFYFLLPFLFFGNKKISNVILFWIIGFFVGFGFAEIYVYSTTNNYIQIGVWRNPNHVNSFEKLYNNFYKACLFLKRDLSYLSVFAISLVFSLFQCVFKKNISIPQLILALFVAYSVYAETVFFGIDEETRSSLCLFFSSIFITIYIFKRKKQFIYSCIIIFSTVFYYHNQQNISYCNAVTNFLFSPLKQIATFVPLDYNVVVLNNNDDFKKIDLYIRNIKNVYPLSTENYSEGPRWKPIAIETGFLNVFTVDWDGMFKDPIFLICKEIKQNNSEWKYLYPYKYRIYKNYLFLKLDI